MRLATEVVPGLTARAGHLVPEDATMRIRHQVPSRHRSRSEAFAAPLRASACGFFLPISSIRRRRTLSRSPLSHCLDCTRDEVGLVRCQSGTVRFAGKGLRKDVLENVPVSPELSDRLTFTIELSASNLEARDQRAPRERTGRSAVSTTREGSDRDDPGAHGQSAEEAKLAPTQNQSY